MKTFIALALSAVALATAGSAGAVTLTFEGASNTIYNAPITRSGVVIGNPDGQEQHFHELLSSNFPNELPSNGTGVLFNDRNTQLSFTLAGGGLFTLGNFDAAALKASGNSSGGANILQVTAFLAGVQGAQVNFDINSDTYSTLSGATLGTFDALLFDGFGGGGGFVLDNVQINEAGDGAVPEPATWAMMIAGFGVVGGALRRRPSVRVAFSA